MRWLCRLLGCQQRPTIIDVESAVRQYGIDTLGFGVGRLFEARDDEGNFYGDGYMGKQGVGTILSCWQTGTITFVRTMKPSGWKVIRLNEPVDVEEGNPFEVYISATMRDSDEDMLL